jgi:hypothetical protein
MEFRKFVFGETLLKAISAIPNEHQLRYYWYIADYGIHGIEPELSDFELSTWVQMKQMIAYTGHKKRW